MSEDLQTRYQLLEQKYQDLQAQYAALALNNSDAMQRVFYRIAERATAGLSFFDFLNSLHQLLGELMYAKNCYVCLYNAEKSTLDFPYYVDERDGDEMQSDNVPCKRGLTEFVLTTQSPQLIDATRLRQLQASGDITEASGDLTFSTWLGVPMFMGGQIAGALVVQSYEAGIQYTAKDAEVLSFVANHFSTAIERYRTIEALKQSEERYRTVIENVGVGVVVVQGGRMVFTNPSMVRIVGRPMEFLLSTPFTASIHPDDVEGVSVRHQKRLRGEPVEQYYGFRVITEKGEIRHLELSAVTIEWNRKAATLLFVVDASARLEAERTQRIALQKQTELNEMKSRFISMASHEFRTPLATIHGSVELLMHYDNRMPADKKRQTLEKIDSAVERMTHMLENVLVIGRTDAGQLQFRPKPLALTPLCLTLVDELRSASTRQFDQIKLQLDLPPVSQKYLLDETLVRNIVGNLLSNAVKYSYAGGKVSMQVRWGDGELHLTVSDQGIGIPQEDQPLLFKSFHRASNVGAVAGTGLGLSIVKQAVDAHAGRIEIDSQVGQGTRFTVMLPSSEVSSEGQP